MYTRKRLCPYQDNDGNIVGMADELACTHILKKPCLDYSGEAQKFAIESQRHEPMTINEDMEIENRFNSTADARLQTGSVPRQPARLPTHNDLGVPPTQSCPVNNNNHGNNSNNNDMYITPSDVCYRCQAGESGHFGHIGR